MLEESHMKPTTEINTTIDYRKIGVHLKEARKANSLSQAQVAASLHISVCAYGNLERGSQRINLTRLIQLCELLGVAPGSILADCTPRLVPYKDRSRRKLFLCLPTGSKPCLHVRLLRGNFSLIPCLCFISSPQSPNSLHQLAS